MAKVVVWADELHGSSYGEIFAEEGMNVEFSTDLAIIPTARIVILIGGCDVYPPLYQEPIGPHTRYTKEGKAMDIEILREGGVLHTAHTHRVPVVGICKGSQLLCVANGGKLSQHVEQPGNHNITCGGETFMTKGGHHQVSYPNHDHARVIGNYMSNDGERFPEVIYYPRAGSWGVQYHPEYQGFEERGRRYFMEKVILTMDGLNPFPQRAEERRNNDAPRPRGVRRNPQLQAERIAEIGRNLGNARREPPRGNDPVVFNEAFVEVPPPPAPGHNIPEGGRIAHMEEEDIRDE